MNSVEKTVADIKLLIAGGDLSDTPLLRRLHQECLQAFKELNANLKQCRALVDNGSHQAARELNCSFEPSLTQVAEYLEFFKNNDFFDVCKEYGLETPVFPDEELLMLLNTPASSGEKRLHVLLQDYRKIARSGTMQQRITLLRKIISKLPDSARWRNDLIAAERSRCQELERELEKCTPDEDSRSKLEDMYREVMAPEWLNPPQKEFIDNLRARLLPLQKAKLSKEVEQKIQLLEECWLERDVERLRKEFDAWNVFSSNPLITLSAGQRQSIADIEAFLKKCAEEKDNEDTCRELIRRIEQRLADNAPFSAIQGDYNQLQLMDCNVPAALAERLKSLEEENRRFEHMRNVRLCIFGICGAILLVVGIVFTVLYMQHYLAVKRSRENMQALLKEGKYEEIIKSYRELCTSSVKVAADPQIIFLHSTAENAKRQLELENQAAENNFIRLVNQIETLSKQDVLDNADALDMLIAEAQKSAKSPALKKESLDKFGRLQTSITQKRTALKQQREADFLKACADIVRKIDGLIAIIPQKQPVELNMKLHSLTETFNEKLAAVPFIPEHLKKQEEKNFKNAVQKYNDAWEKEKAFRLVDAPATLSRYVRALDGIRYKYPDLAQEYHKVFSRIKGWVDESKIYELFIPETFDDVQDIKIYKNGLFAADLKKYMPSATRSAAFAKFFSGIQKQQDLKELVFSDAAGTKYFFYVPGEVKIERLRRPARTNIIFIAEPVNNEKSRRFIFSCSAKNAALPFTVTSRHNDLPYTMPAGFADLSGETEISPELCSKLWPGYELATRFSGLSSDGPGLHTNLQNALKYLCQKNDIKNFYLKELFIVNFLRELLNCGKEFYPEIEAQLTALQDFQQNRKRNWRAPQAFKEYAAECDELTLKWNQLDLERLINVGKMRGDFICAAHARKPVPVGVIRSIGDGKIKIHLFDGHSQPVEGLIMENKTFHTLPASVWQGVLSGTDKLRSRLFKGQLVWGFSDGKKSQDFLREWQKKAREFNVNLGVRPSVLPAELNY